MARSSRGSRQNVTRKPPIKRSESPDWTVATTSGNEQNKKSKLDDSCLENTVNTMKELKIQQESRVEDDFERFGKLVGNELRKIVDSTSLQWTKWKIIDQLYQQTLQNFVADSNNKINKNNRECSTRLSSQLRYGRGQHINELDQAEDRGNKSFELMENLIDSNMQHMEAINSSYDIDVKSISASLSNSDVEEFRCKACCEDKTTQILSPAVDKLVHQSGQFPFTRCQYVYKYICHTTSPSDIGYNDLGDFNNFNEVDGDHFC